MAKKKKDYVLPKDRKNREQRQLEKLTRAHAPLPKVQSPARTRPAPEQDAEPERGLSPASRASIRFELLRHFGLR